MTNSDEKEVFSLVSAPNWSVRTDLSNLKGKPRNTLICPKHKNQKLAILIHEIEGFVIEESNLPFKVILFYLCCTLRSTIFGNFGVSSDEKFIKITVLKFMVCC